MFNRDALFGKKDEGPRNEPRSSVNVTPGLGGSNPPLRAQPAPEPSRPDLRFAEVPQRPQQQPQPRAEEPAGSRLTVGPDIKLRGVEITDCDTLVVEGRVEASMDSRVIQIAECGVFSGTVSIDVAEIHGRFEGQLTARKQLVIYSTGRVSGQIRYGKIRIEEGGELSGDVSTLAKAPAAAAASAPAASTTPASAASATPAAPAPAAAASAAPAAASTSPSTNTLHVQRPAQPATPRAESQPAAAAAAREPAPARPPRQGGKSGNAGVNTV
jgi:cytoskeletal protein CcmA (bactofilin family)